MIRAARPNIIEEPVKIFSGTVKGLPRLSAASTCVDGGILATWAGKLDLFGADRLKGRAPDIGAEEL
jgi:hypothetical protein